MSTIAKQASSYIKTGQVKSRQKDIDRGAFKEMSLLTIFYGAFSESWRRYSTEILAVLLFGSWALYIWGKLS